MNGRKETSDNEPNERVTEAPSIETPDWDEIAAAEISDTPAEIEFEELPEEELPEESDDNPYQESDEALPEDNEERAIRRNERNDASPFTK